MIKSLKRIALKQWFFHIKNKENKYFYQMLGMRRSGNHAILNWMLHQMPGKSCFNNNMGAFHPPENTPIKKAVIQKGDRYNLLISYEDKPTTLLLREYSQERYGESAEKCSILLLRDPLNWLASQYAWKEDLGRKFREDEPYRRNLINLYKEHAALFLNWQTPDSNENYIAVNYNKWVISKEYRSSLAEQLRLDFTDKGRDRVEMHGTGSSFSGTNLKGTELKVLERWKIFEDDAFFQKLADDEMRAIGRNIFKMEY